VEALAVILEAPGQLGLSRVMLNEPGPEDVVVDISWSGISTGTERLLWSGRMPPFPGLSYPLVPGYESVGTIQDAGPDSGRQPGDVVFVPGANCFGPIRGLFGGAASRLVVPGRRVLPIASTMHETGTLLALAATALHALAGGAPDTYRFPDLIVGHGVLGRLLARIVVALNGPAPTVWETQAERRFGRFDYPVIDPTSDDRKDYRRILDASGDSDGLDGLIARLARGGEIVLAGFYEKRVGFAFPAAFMREASFRIAAEWRPSDLAAVHALLDTGALRLDDLITHRQDAGHAPAAYVQAFEDPACLKMVLDWRHAA
jgi:bacteriochlorophyllide a dehydrogenase